MNIHKNARTTPYSRLLMARRVDAGERVAKVASDFCVSEQTVRKWVRRWRMGGESALRDRSSRPARLRGTAPQQIAEIERLRRRRLSSPAIARQLAIASSTVRKILRRLGLNRLKALDPPAAVVRYERQRPGELLHLDTKKLGRIAGIGHRITGRRPGAINRHHGIGWEALHVCIDDASRLAYSEILPDERKESAAAFLDRALAWFARSGVAVERIMTDNGSGYRSQMFRQVCAKHGLRHLRTRPYTPRTNGKPNGSSKPACASGSMPDPMPARTSAARNCQGGCTITIRNGRIALWPIARRPSGSRIPCCLVRPRSPLLRPDLALTTIVGSGRGKDRRRRPAAAGAQRPCRGRKRRSH